MGKSKSPIVVGPDYRMKVINFLKIYGYYNGILVRMDMQRKYISGELSLDELKVKLAQIDTLQADSAFVKYLESQYLVGNQADFQELQAKLIAVDNLLAGNISAELEHVIHLTAENVQADEAFIKEIIASQIMVSDLRAGNIIYAAAKQAEYPGKKQGQNGNIKNNTCQF